MNPDSSPVVVDVASGHDLGSSGTGAEVGVALAAIAGHTTDVVEMDPGIAEARDRLNPVLREMLNTAESVGEHFEVGHREEGFLRQEYLLNFIDRLNEKFDELLETQVHMSRGHLVASAGEGLMNCVTSDADLLNKGGVLSMVEMVLRVFAKTVLREKIGELAGGTYDADKFKQQLALQQIMIDLLAGARMIC